MQPFCRALHVVGLCGSLAARFPRCVIPSLPPLSRAGAGASLCCPEVCSGEAKQALCPINCPNNLRNLPGEAFTEPLLPPLQCALRFPHPGSILAAGHDVQLGAGAAAAGCSTRRAPSTLDQTGTGRSGARETSREQQNWGSSGQSWLIEQVSKEGHRCAPKGDQHCAPCFLQKHPASAGESCSPHTPSSQLLVLLGLKHPKKQRREPAPCIKVTLPALSTEQKCLC